MDDSATEQAASGEGRRAIDLLARPQVVIGGLLVLLAGLPLAMGLVAQRQPQWYPLMDLAQIELLIRDIDTSNTPLVGNAGRLGAYGEQGNHPGPLTLYALWPVYKLLGSTAWALQVSTVAVNLCALGAAIWIAHRRGGRYMALALTVGLAVLVHSYGPYKFLVPWNPYMALSWWIVFLLAVWSVLVDDLPLLPVAVLAGSFCLQAHVSYLGLVGGLGIVAVGVLTASAMARRGDPAAQQRLGLGVLGSGTLLAILWLPPLVEQLSNTPGNLSVLRKTFANPAESPVGLDEGSGLWLGYMDPFALVGNESPFLAASNVGEPLRGAVILAFWLASVVAAWRLRREHPDLWRLQLVIAASLGLQLVTISRIHGPPWHYLLLSAWATLVLMVFALGWTAMCAWSCLTASGTRPALPGERLAQARTAGVALAVAVLVASTTTLAYRSTIVEPELALDARAIQDLGPATVEALESEQAPGGGHEGRHLVTWSQNALSIPAAGFGLLLELERQGFDAGAYPDFGVEPHHVLARDEATASVHYVIGPHYIEPWRRTPGAVEVGYFEPRSPEEIAEFDRLHEEVAAGLRATGADDLVELLDSNLLNLQLHPRTPPDLQDSIKRMIDLGLPAAVFVAPPDVAPPADPA